MITEMTLYQPGFHGEMYTHGFVGAPIDERTSYSIGCCRSVVCGSIIQIQYDPDDISVTINGSTSTSPDVISSATFGVVKGCRVFIDATSLGFMEVLIIINSLRHVVDIIDILYVEPGDYVEKGDAVSRLGNNVLRRRDFDLSDVLGPVSSVPGFCIARKGDCTAIFLGYEGERFDRIIEEGDIDFPRCYPVFGVPAFRAGWEKNSFINNLSVFTDRGVDVCAEISYAPASSPQSAYDELDRFLSAAIEERITVCPIGSKPHGIGVALFAVDHPDQTAILYDFPINTTGRTSPIGRSHLYEIRD